MALLMKESHSPLYSPGRRIRIVANIPLDGSLRLFEYTNREHFQRTLSTGSIRINTLHKCRSNESRKEIRDSGEGKKEVSGGFDRLDWSKRDKIPKSRRLSSYTFY